jgi:hypothetical protein
VGLEHHSVLRLRPHTPRRPAPLIVVGSVCFLHITARRRLPAPRAPPSSPPTPSSHIAIILHRRRRLRLLCRIRQSPPSLCPPSSPPAVSFPLAIAACRQSSITHAAIVTAGSIHSPQSSRAPAVDTVCPPRHRHQNQRRSPTPPSPPGCRGPLAAVYRTQRLGAEHSE